MKRLNPAMRENYRYILVKIEPYDAQALYAWASEEKHETRSQYNAKELYYTISAAITDWYGDYIAAQIGVAVPAIVGPFAIIRMRRNTEKDVFAILPFIREHLHAEIRLAALQTSGTIHTLKEEIYRKQKYLRMQKPVFIEKAKTEMKGLMPDMRLDTGDTEIDLTVSMWVHTSGAVDIDLSSDNLDRKENGFNHVRLQYLTKDDLQGHIMMNQQQAAYDRAITVFSPDGRLYQVEYAREAVKRGTTAVGIKVKDGIVLLVDKRISSRLLESNSVEKIFRIDEHIGVASSGLVGDARSLIDRARIEAQINRISYGEAIDVETLAKKLGDHMQTYTQFGGARPYGTALLIAGVSDGEFRLFETDPSGTLLEYKATGIGTGRPAVMKRFENEYDPDITVAEAVALGISALHDATEGKFELGTIEIGIVDLESGFKKLSRSEVEALIPKDLLLPKNSDEQTEKESTSEEVSGQSKPRKSVKKDLSDNSENSAPPKK